MAATRSCNFRFTWNNYPIEAKSTLESLESLRYLVAGYETAPTTGTPHLQGFIAFKNARYLKSVRKLLSGCDVRVADYPQECIDYCKKDGDFFEVGTPLKSKKEQGELGKAAYEKAWDLAKQGRIEEISEPLRTRYLKTYQSIAAANKPQPEELTEFENEWVWGPPDAGKSYYARHNNGYSGTPYIKEKNKWWDDYKDEPVVVIDEIDPDMQYMYNYLKIWGDKYPFRAEFKGGSKMIRPKKLIITSNYSMDQVFAGKMMGPLTKRFKEVHMPTPFPTDDVLQETAQAIRETIHEYSMDINDFIDMQKS